MKTNRPRLTSLKPRLSTLDTRRVKPAQKVADPFYGTSAWRSLMARLLAERGRRCEACGRTGCRIYGDHRRELQDGGAALDPSNVMLLCAACHTRKTDAVRRERARQMYGDARQAPQERAGRDDGEAGGGGWGCL
jgi:5-methylcytosine-specific restriction protein A